MPERDVVGRERDQRLLDAHELGFAPVTVLLEPIGVDLAARFVVVVDRAQQIRLAPVARQERRRRHPPRLRQRVLDAEREVTDVDLVGVADQRRRVHLRPFKYVPFVLFRSVMITRSSRTTIRACLRDTFLCGNTTWLPCVRPSVISSSANTNARRSPSFALTKIVSTPT